MAYPLVPGRLVVAALLAGLVPFATSVSAQTPPPLAPGCSLTWIGREPALEQFLTSAVVTRMEAVPIGVTKPQRAYLEPGPVARMAWKQLPPQRRGGFMESYKAEIAAYHLDRLLDLHMVPPVVERAIDGSVGAAVLWIENTTGWDLKKPVQGPEPAWSKQISRMKLFDQLIGNIDRNQGNLMYDADWHVFLIDHSRAFTTRKSIEGIAAPGIIDAALWRRIEALTPADVDQALGPWLSAAEREAIFARRARMQQAVARLVKQKGAAAVFLE